MFRCVPKTWLVRSTINKIVQLRPLSGKKFSLPVYHPRIAHLNQRIIVINRPTICHMSLLTFVVTSDHKIITTAVIVVVINAFFRARHKMRLRVSQVESRATLQLFSTPSSFLLERISKFRNRFAVKIEFLWNLTISILKIQKNERVAIAITKNCHFVSVDQLSSQ